MWAACGAPTPDAKPAETGGVAEFLPLSLQVEVRRDSVHFALHVTNPTANAIQLEFGDAQRFDFEVRSADGAQVWRWSADQIFAQVVGQETMAPGESLKYEAVWHPAAGVGSYTVTGRLLTQPQAREQRASFEI
jgi:hypothetical protein